MDKRILLVIPIVISIGLFFIYSEKQPESLETAVLTRVIDGDTVELDNGDRVRLIGINTPERGDFYYDESKKMLVDLVENKSVKLEKDVEDKDRYGRLLRYIYLDDKFINLELLKAGYANTYFIKPNVKHNDALTEAYEYAIDNQLNLWKLSKYSGCISIEDFHYFEEKNDPDNEYVIMKNICGYDLDLNKWTLKDEARHEYEFKNLLLKSSSTITINSGIGKDTSSTLFWGYKRTVWNDDGDTLYLRDNLGYLVLNYAYGK